MIEFEETKEGGERQEIYDPPVDLGDKMGTLANRIADDAMLVDTALSARLAAFKLLTAYYFGMKKIKIKDGDDEDEDNDKKPSSFSDFKRRINLVGDE